MLAASRKTLPAIIVVVLAASATILALYYMHYAQPSPIAPSGKNSSPIITASNPAAQRGMSRANCSNTVRIVVLVDNNAYNKSLETAWGLAVYVEAYCSRFLFDTGPSPLVLERNSKKLGVDLKRIDFIVLSHEHGDHTGGLSLLARLKPGLRVYIPQNSPSLEKLVVEEGLDPVPVSNTTMIARGVYVVGPLYGPPWEEALAINTSRGFILLVGCSHPGVVRLAREAARSLNAKPFIVIGGFHLIGSPRGEVEETIRELIEMGFEKIYPIHCSGVVARELLAEKYPKVYGGGGVGLEIMVGEPHG